MSESLSTPPNQLRILAFDLGEKRIGLALWQPEAQMASSLPYRLRKTLKEDLNFFESLISQHQAEALLLGLPVSLGGKVTPSTERTFFWRDELQKRFKLPIFLFDEALSSQEAERRLKTLGTKNWKEKKDSLSAAIFLEGFIREKTSNLDH